MDNVLLTSTQVISGHIEYIMYQLILMNVIVMICHQMKLMNVIILRFISLCTNGGMIHCLSYIIQIRYTKMLAGCGCQVGAAGPPGRG